MQVARWGNSLAVRIPADVARVLGIKEGDDIHLHPRSEGGLEVLTEQQRRQAVVAEIRSMAVRFPADYKFDRDEANAR